MQKLLLDPEKEDTEMRAATQIGPGGEAREIVALLQELSGRAHLAPAELEASWPALERRVVRCLRVLQNESPQDASQAAEIERLRNLAWEVGVSIDLRCLHARALHTLTERLATRVAKARSARSDAASSEPVVRFGIG